MARPSNFLTGPVWDMIISWPAKINAFLNYIIDELIGSPTLGHDHNGTNSKKVDHINLTSVGTNTHSQIDTAISNSVNHIADSTIHVTTTDKTNWNGTKTEVEDARNSTAKSHNYDTLDQRLEAIESETTPSAHDSLSGRHTTATGNNDNESRHKAEAIQDVTLSQTVQHTLDDLNSELDDKVDKSSVIADINSSIEGITIDGDKVDLATDTLQGTVKLATGGAAPFSHVHEEADILAIDKPSNDLYVDGHFNLINIGASLRNYVANGGFVFAGNKKDGSRILSPDPIANQTYPFAIPGWELDTTSTTYEAQVKLSDVANPKWEGYSTRDSAHQSYYAWKFLKFTDTSWNEMDDHKFYSYSWPTMYFTNSIPEYAYTLIVWYRKTTATTNECLSVGIAYSDSAGTFGIELPNFSVEDGVATTTPFKKNDTDWHCVAMDILTPSPDTTASARVEMAISENNIIIGPVTILRGPWTSSAHLIPPQQYCRYDLPIIEYTQSSTSNITSDAEDFWRNTPIYRQVYKTETTLDDTFTGTLTLNIPPAQYIYDVIVSFDYTATITVDTPPVNIPVQYSMWNRTNTCNYNGIPILAIPLSLPPPDSGTTGNITITVEYWPAPLTPATWS